MRSIIAVLALWLDASGAHASPVHEIPFQFRDGFIWLQVSVTNSNEPLNFLLDTGASASVIDLSAARRLGLKLGDRVRVFGVNSVTEGFWPQRLKAKSGPISLPNHYLALELAKLSKSCSMQVDGLIGADFFKSKVIQIDFATRMLRILDAKEAKHVKGEVLPLDIRRCGMRVPVAVDGGKPQWARLDTGCASALHSVRSSVSPGNCTERIAVGVTEFSIPTTRSTVLLGTTKFVDVPTDVHTKAIFPGEAGLLGNGLLARFAQVTIDTKGQRLVLAPW